MKKLVIIVSLIFTMAIPMRSQANLNAAQIVGAYRLGITACAFQLQLLNIVGGQFLGSEALKRNSLILATLNPLFTLAVVTLVANSMILFGSPAFQAASGLQPDIMLTDQQCEDLEEGDDMTFTGSDGAIIAIMTISALFVLANYAMLINSSGFYDDVDLSKNAVAVQSLLNGSKTIGTGTLTGGSSAGGGCSLIR